MTDDTNTPEPPKPPASSAPHDWQGWPHQAALNPVTAIVLARFAKRRRWLLLIRGAAASLIVWIVLASFVAWADQTYWLTLPIRIGLSTLVYAASALALWWFAMRVWGENQLAQIARQLQATDPQLRQDILSAVELADQQNGSACFRDRLQQVVARRVAKVRLNELLPLRLLRPWLVTAAALSFLVLALMVVPSLQVSRRLARVLLPGLPIERASFTRMRLIQPDPATGPVASGDAVAIVVGIENTGIPNRFSEVTLEYQSESLERVEVAMQPREGIPNRSADHNGSETRFAANLSVGNSPIDYRVKAGDAITCWYTLTPSPRPKVIRFEKRYVMPAYAELADRYETSDHGDLRALVGSRVELTATFDQPVHDAVLSYGSHSSPQKMTAVEEKNGTKFRTDIRIGGSQTYQIDALSKQSGLNNPYAESYGITGVIDVPPIVRWAPAIASQQVVSPVDVLNLTAFASDELPIKKLFQQYQINSTRDVHQRELSFEANQAETEIHWRWDLLALTDSQGDKIQLNSGDLVRTRLVAIDRAGQKSHSEFIERLIADEGFRADRHEHLDRLHRVFRGLTQWASEIGASMAIIAAPAQNGDIDELTEILPQLDDPFDNFTVVVEALGDFIPTCRDASMADRLEQTGRSIAGLKEKAHQWRTLARWLVTHHPSLQLSEASKWCNELGEQAQQMGEFADQIEQFVRAQLSHEVFLAIASDHKALENSIASIIQSPSTDTRWEKHAMVWAGRLDELDQRVARYESDMLSSSNPQLEGWRGWMGRWKTALQNISASKFNQDRAPQTASEFYRDLQRWTNREVYDGRIASMIIGSLRELPSSSGEVGTLVNQIGDLRSTETIHNEKAQLLDGQLSGDQASDDVPLEDSRLVDQWNQLRLTTTTGQALALIEHWERLHHRHRDVDVQWIADLHLFQRALASIVDLENQAVDAETFRQVSQAIKTLNAGHSLRAGLTTLNRLADRESEFVYDHFARLDHPLRFESFSATTEKPVALLQTAGISWDQIQPLHEIRTGSDYTAVRDRLARRRWSIDLNASEEQAMRSLASKITDELIRLEPVMVSARETLQKWGRSIAQMARGAADEIEQSQQKNSPISDSVDSSIEQTVDALHDLANTSDPFSHNQRELARDADAAAARLLENLKLARTTRGKPKRSTQELGEETDTPWDRLAKTLRDVANHFESAQQGKSITQSRQQLRQSERELGVDEKFQRRHQGIEQAVEASKQSPESLLARLEKQLKDDVQMQSELQSITEANSQSVQRKLAALAQQQQDIGSRLERADPEITETKRQLAKQIASIGRSVARIDQSALGMIQQLGQNAGLSTQESALEEARRLLSSAAKDSTGKTSETDRLMDLRKTAFNMAVAMQQATKLLDELEQKFKQAQQTQAEAAPQARSVRQAQLERIQRSVRKQTIDQFKSERKRWTTEQSQSERRASQARRQVDQLEQQLAKLREQAGDNSSDSAVQSLQNRLDSALRSETAIEKTTNHAKSQRQSAGERVTTTQRQPLSRLDEPNPSAQLATQFAQQTNNELMNLRRQLGQISQTLDREDSVRPAVATAKNLVEKQRHLAEDVDQAAESLRRSARHQQRLGELLPQDQLNTLSQQIKQKTLSATNRATNSLESAVISPAQTGQASRDIESARQQVQAAADELTKRLQMASRNNRETASSENVNPQSRRRNPSGARAKAKTLDELDRAINRGRPLANAGEASRTIAQMVDAKQRQAARSRRRSAQSGSARENHQWATQGNSSGDRKTTTSESSQLAGDSAPENSGTGTAAGLGGGKLDLAAVKRAGAQWGQLRRKRTDEVSQGKTTGVPARYRREIEAYFQALAKQAAETP